MKRIAASVTVRSAAGQLRARTLTNPFSRRGTPLFFADDAGGLRSFLSTTSPSTSNSSSDEPRKWVHGLPAQYLRAMDSTNYDPVTLQRTDCSYDGHTGKPLLPKLDAAPSAASKRQEIAVQDCRLIKDKGVYEIKWTDGLISQYSKDWLDEQLFHWIGVDGTNITSYASSKERLPSSYVLWSGLTEDMVRSPSSSLCIPFDETIRDEEGMMFALRALYTHGILLVTDTPLYDQGAGVAALAASLGGGSVKDKNSTSLLASYRRYNKSDEKDRNSSNPPPTVLPRGTDGPLRTLYGTVWSTTTAGQDAGTSVADSAYGHDGLPLHTDMTYHRDPPGLQIFTMVQPAAHGGGASVFGDGFAAAAALQKAHPDAFATLSQTVRRYRSVDPVTGWHLEASGPVIQLDSNNGRVVMIRHNDLDRLPDLPPRPSGVRMDDGDIDAFYQRLDDAHVAWDEILARDDMRLEMRLQSGDTMVVANQVCMLSFVGTMIPFDQATACGWCSLMIFSSHTRVAFLDQRCFHGRYSFEASTEHPRSVTGCYVSQDELSSRFRMCGFYSY